ncbi:exo-alpha-sialidase [Streptomyces sp. Rer75]|uniref:sialidase family protein n=1 Tax=Streptomyces sp. Rer75 TaxID=2750011 RepID=UPI0015D03B5F|nr:sialidase family protein [Streptomyces sp. Rer75]QLH19753.1 exo-alpha-sialidase [Streptomyces sp. Rer75]
MTVHREFVLRDDPRFGHCHASTLLSLPDGDVLAAWFAGSREGAADVAIWLARRTGDGWGAPVKVADEAGLPHWNPVLFATGHGEVLLFYKTGHRIPDWRTRVLRSRDGGLSWSAPAELVPGADGAGGRGPVKNKPIRLADGGWLAPASVEEPRSAGGRWDAFTDRSDDGGASWRRSAPVPLDRPAFPGAGVIQPALWESAPGEVRMLLRSSCGRVCRSASHDGGATWSTARPLGVPNNNSGLDAVRLADGRVVLAHNPVAAEWGARTPLVLSVSEGDGITWRRAVVLEDRPVSRPGAIVPDETGVRTDGHSEFSYPAVVPWADGVAVVYTWQRRGIAFATVSEAALRRNNESTVNR